ncbi:hypothetical protein CF327_g5657 [Tilletia walkeri]|uniref:Aquaporin n=1 Tax=Tilletia walkeri TaxID=117179 RepID=A0A8X7T477_9BASI|nr:hypothetical protein CF327_g5657 [Tilletia walkeri]KAE8267523.1 hypothetical protein A4X09_0g4820 [Tilletia walkeri]
MKFLNRNNAEHDEVDSSALEKGEQKHHHHPHLHRPHVHHRRKREAETIQNKLPSVMKTDDLDEGDLDKLRKRLNVKNEIVAGIAEFVGTFLFLLFALGIATQAGQQQLSDSASSNVEGGNQGATLDTNQLLFSSLGFGFSLAVNAWVFFRVSGGLFNPAVTLGLFLSGALTWYRSVILTIVQFVAAIAAAGVAQLITPGGINARTKLGSSTTVAQGFFIEMFSTAMLMLTIYLLAGEKHKGTFLAPVGIGLALFMAELYATGLTGGSLNPARTLGPDVIASSFEGSTWIYYAGPYVGVLVSAAIYWLLKISKYETANSGQDDDDTALLLRDAKGNLTGAVEKVSAADAPELPGLQDKTEVPAEEPARETDRDTVVGLSDSKEEGKLV